MQRPHGHPEGGRQLSVHRPCILLLRRRILLAILRLHLGRTEWAFGFFAAFLPASPAGHSVCATFLSMKYEVIFGFVYLLCMGAQHVTGPWAAVTGCSKNNRETKLHWSHWVRQSANKLQQNKGKRNKWVISPDFFSLSKEYKELTGIPKHCRYSIKKVWPNCMFKQSLTYKQISWSNNL